MDFVQLNLHETDLSFNLKYGFLQLNEYETDSNDGYSIEMIDQSHGD